MFFFRQRKSYCIFCVLFSFLFFTSLNVYSAPSELILKAQQLLKSADSIKAYDLLKPYEDELSGEIEYDYLFGVAALDSGEPRQSIFVFQRLIMIDPNFAGARMELARAYFEIGEYDQAKSEFTILKSMAPPKQTEAAIDKYLTAIENRTLKKKQGLHGYVLFGLGDDSNANNATSTPSFLGVPLNNESVETSSNVLLARTGFVYNLPVDYYQTYFVTGNISSRSNSDVSYANSLSMDVSAGIQHKLYSGNILGTSIQYYSTEVDGNFNNSGVMLTGQFGSKISVNDQLSTFVRVGGIRFADEFTTKDVNQGLLGLSWVHVFDSYKRPSVNTSLIFGIDDAVEKDSPFGRNYYAINFSNVVAMSNALNLFASAGLIQSEYDSAFFGLTELRSDTQTIASLGLSWYPNKIWTMQPVVRYVNNESNVQLYQYDKVEFLVTLRSDF